MRISAKLLIVALLIVVVGGVILIRQNQGKMKTINPAQEKLVSETSQALPRLLDLGAGKCIPCKMMAPLLEELRKEYRGQFEVVFIDVWENPEQAQSYAIALIPTQIFYDVTGRELFRHEGFFSKEDILAKWRELGIHLTPVL